MYLCVYVCGCVASRRADWTLKTGKRKFRCETCTDILEDFVAANGKRPTSRQKAELLRQVGLTRRQLSYWFDNRRRSEAHKMEQSQRTQPNRLSLCGTSSLHSSDGDSPVTPEPNSVTSFSDSQDELDFCDFSPTCFDKEDPSCNFLHCLETLSFKWAPDHVFIWLQCYSLSVSQSVRQSFCMSGYLSACLLAFVMLFLTLRKSQLFSIALTLHFKCWHNLYKMADKFQIYIL